MWVKIIMDKLIYHDNLEKLQIMQPRNTQLMHL